MLPIEVAGYRLEAHEVENARYRAPIWFIHGLWTGAWCWRPFGSFLAHRGWEALALDLRGRPESRPAATGRIKIADYVEDVVAVAQARGGSAPILIGHDLGALVALVAAERIACRAVVALAPPFATAVLEPFREALAARRGLLRSRVPPPAIDAGEALERERLIDDSPRVARALVEGADVPARAAVPVLVVAGTDDPWLDPRALAAEAERRGFAFLERPARHWQLGGKGFERQADLIHRWLVRELGGELLQLTGFEDLDEESGD